MKIFFHFEKDDLQRIKEYTENATKSLYLDVIHLGDNIYLSKEQVKLRSLNKNGVKISSQYFEDDMFFRYSFTLYDFILRSEDNKAFQITSLNTETNKTEQFEKKFVHFVILFSVNKRTLIIPQETPQ